MDVKSSMLKVYHSSAELYLILTVLWFSVCISYFILFFSLFSDVEFVRNGVNAIHHDPESTYLSSKLTSIRKR